MASRAMRTDVCFVGLWMGGRVRLGLCIRWVMRLEWGMVCVGADEGGSFSLLFCFFVSRCFQVPYLIIVFLYARSQDDEFIAFHDINPSAQLHLLLIPRSHIPTIHSLTPTHLPLLTRMLERGRTILHSHGFTEQQQQQLGFHVPPFTSVSHLHLHVLGLPYRSWLRSVKYPRRDRTWGWFVKGTVVERSLERARERGEKGGWRWGWV
ncbi:HIT-like domain-containing protein [Powellomyces hirtus]|nr:HIT-like domain-containing protein [Powellomyces hirtus]